MTFNRYIFLRMIVEFIGVCCCTIQLFIGNTLVGLTVAGVVERCGWWCGNEAAGQICSAGVVPMLDRDIIRQMQS